MEDNESKKEKTCNQEELNKKLLELIEECSNAEFVKNEEVEKVIQEFKMIYNQSFTHLYSNFYSKILDIFHDQKLSLDVLSLNLRSIMQQLITTHFAGVQSRDKPSPYRSIYKLCDHLLLELGRRDAYEQYNNKANEINRKYEEANKKLEIVQSDLKGSQNQVITVLGVFAAIVITFAGGFNYLQGILAATSGKAFFEIAFIAVICGGVLFNILYLLLQVVCQLNREKLFNKKWFLIIFNVIIFLLLVVFGILGFAIK